MIEIVKGPVAAGERFAQVSHQAGHFFALVDRHPTVAVFDDTRNSELVPGAHQYLRAARLKWLRTRPHRFEFDHLAVELRNVVGPYLAHCQNALAGPLPAILEVDAVIRHFLGAPA